MKKRLINLRIIVFGSLLSLSGNALFGQDLIPYLPPVSSQEKCGSAKIHHHLMLNDPEYAIRMQEYENSVVEYNNSITPKVPAQYKIPVVVHVMHKGEAVGVGTNVSDLAIRNAIKDLNDRYRKIAGTGGFGNGVDVGIEFALAVRDPSGACTNGITRHSMTGNSSYMNAGLKLDGAVGMAETTLKAVIDWAPTKYYNIWLVSEIDNNNGGAGVQGFAYFASSHGSAIDGAVILASNFTSGFSMTATHELGHALNLFHTFEGDDNGCPGQVNGCGDGIGDCCGDIPRHVRSQSDCNVTGTNSCDGNSSNALFARNYMDYASDDCVNMFTANQKTRAQLACSGPRASYFASSNLALVPPSAPTADFTATNSIICSGQTVTFTDISSCVPNTYLGETSWAGTTFSWTFTNGSTVLTSTLQNPTMTFTVAGAYDVTLTVTTPAGTSTTTEMDYVILGGTMATACTPTSQYNNQNAGQTISNVKFNTIDNSTSQYLNTTLTNFSCDQNTIVQSGNTYTLSITANAGPSGAERFEVYIDYNNNGVYNYPAEMVHSGQAAAGSQTALTTTTLTANVTIPATAITNTLLRMRVIGQTQAFTASHRSCASGGAGQLFIGDVEDYGVYIQSSGCTSAPAIGTQPAASTICAGSNTTFAVASTGATSYQWQVSTNSGSTWTNITNGGVYSTATTGTLTVTAATASMSTYRYRCISTNACGSTNSAGVILTVNATPSAALAAFSNVCSYNPAFSLTGGTPAGGTYSGSGVNGSGVFNPATAGVGTAVITYSVTQNGCTKSVTSPIVVGACLGIDDQSADDLLILYPNPVEGWMTIEGENLAKYQQVELRDATGRLVSSWKVENTKMNIDLSAFAAGQYTVRISGTANETVRKIQIVK